MRRRVRHEVSRRGATPLRSVSQVVVLAKTVFSPPRRVLCVRSRLREKAMVRPSGAKTGPAPPDVPGTSRKPVPSAPTTKIFVVFDEIPPGRAENAIKLPSGDHDGASSPPRPAGNRLALNSRRIAGDDFQGQRLEGESHEGQARAFGGRRLGTRTEREQPNEPRKNRPTKHKAHPYLSGYVVPVETRGYAWWAKPP